MNTTLLILPTTNAVGPTQMAFDEVMMLATENGIASFRFYTWNEPTLSLGYFQSSAMREGLTAKLPYLRRSSGGGAIVHDHELTYCLALPPGKQWHSAESWTCRFHHLIVKALRSLGVYSRTLVCGEEQKRGDFLCFEHHTPGDIIVENEGRHKIVGSAQRRHRGGLMQHGSILLSRSASAPSLPGVAELTGNSISASDLEAAILRELRADTGWVIREEFDWGSTELCKTDEIRTAKYGNPEWNDKR